MHNFVLLVGLFVCLFVFFFVILIEHLHMSKDDLLLRVVIEECAILIVVPNHFTKYIEMF